MRKNKSGQSRKVTIKLRKQTFVSSHLLTKEESRAAFKTISGIVSAAQFIGGILSRRESVVHFLRSRLYSGHLTWVECANKFGWDVHIVIFRKGRYEFSHYILMQEPYTPAVAEKIFQDLISLPKFNF